MDAHDVLFLSSCSSDLPVWLTAYLVADEGTVSDEACRFIPSQNRFGDDTHRKVEPLKESTGLFLEFAKLELSESAISEFVQRYGDLVGDENCVVVRPKNKIKLPKGVTLAGNPVRAADFNSIFKEADSGRLEVMDDNCIMQGDSFERWRREILRMKACVKLWNTLEAIGASGRIEVPGISVKHSEMSDLRCRISELVVTVDEQEERFCVFSESPNLLEVLATEIDLKLKTSSSLRLVPSQNRLPRVVTCSNDLLSAMWTQFAMAVCHTKTYRECSVCGTPFEVSQIAARNNRTLCSTSCKFQAHRKRKSQVVKLHVQGKSCATIAAQLGIGITSVQTWLAKHMKSEGLSEQLIAKKLSVTVKDVQELLMPKRRNGK